MAEQTDPNVIDMDAGSQGPACKVCGNDLWWEECGACGGEGDYDLYDEDPLYYDEGDTGPCPQCGGTGGWYICLNYSNHVQPTEPPF